MPSFCNKQCNWYICLAKSKIVKENSRYHLYNQRIIVLGKRTKIYNQLSRTEAFHLTPILMRKESSFNLPIRKLLTWILIFHPILLKIIIFIKRCKARSPIKDGYQIQLFQQSTNVMKF